MDAAIAAKWARYTESAPPRDVTLVAPGAQLSHAPAAAAAVASAGEVSLEARVVATGRAAAAAAVEEGPDDGMEDWGGLNDAAIESAMSAREAEPVSDSPSSSNSKASRRLSELVFDGK